MPIRDGGIPLSTIDLDSDKVSGFLLGLGPGMLSKADCVIIYRDITAVIEIKLSYPEKAIRQLRSTGEVLYDHWDEFLISLGLDRKLPRPSEFYFYVEKSLGESRYEVNSTSLVLYEKSEKGTYKGPIQRVKGAPIKVYTQEQILNEYSLYGGK